MSAEQSLWTGKHVEPFVSQFLPLTCCSNAVITSTAWCRILSLDSTLSVLRCTMHMCPNSWNASFMSFTRILRQKEQTMSFS